MSHMKPIPAFATSPAPTFTGYEYICCDCQRIERTPTPIKPLGWDIVEHDCSGDHAIRCPDCNEAIEQRHFQSQVMIDEVAFVTSAVIAAQAASEASAELLRFHREGPASPSMPFTIDLMGEIAEAFCHVASLYGDYPDHPDLIAAFNRTRHMMALMEPQP